MIKKYKIPTIIGIIILLVGTFAGVILLKTTQVFRIGASATAVPKDLRVSNISGNTATISWITEGQTTDFISWGKAKGNLNNIEKEDDTDQKFFTHSISLTGLTADTTYYYKINSEGSNFDNNGIPWQFTTGGTLSSSQNSNPISGSVITSSGQPSKRALIYIDIDGYLLSTLTSDAGNFVVQLGDVRTSDLKGLAQIDQAQTLLAVSVQAEDGSTASAQIYPQSANPIPPLILGQVQDYRSLEPGGNSQAPSADLNLPANASQESKFNVSTPSGTPKPTSVILESLNEGEVVTSTQPQFFGKGPSGETITVTIHSDQQISDKVQIPKNGSWAYSPSTPLSEGTHSITISWTDAAGIVRTLTRDFVVQAGEVPAFTASQSGSTPKATAKAGTPTPSATPKITPTPIPTKTASPSATLRASPSATPKPVPVTGEFIPTLLLSFVGIAVIVFGFGVWKLAEDRI